MPINDFNILEVVKEEQNIDNLRKLFLETIESYEGQLIQIQQQNDEQTDLLQQQLSDSNAAANALKEQIKSINAKHEADLDNIRAHERQMEDLLKETIAQNNKLKAEKQEAEVQRLMEDSQHLDQSNNAVSILSSHASLLQDDLTRLQSENLYLKTQINKLKDHFLGLQNQIKSLRSVIQCMNEQVYENIKTARMETNRICGASVDLFYRLKGVYTGLEDLKMQVHNIETTVPKIPEISFRSIQARLQRKLAAYLTRIKEDAEDAANEKNIDSIHSFTQQATQILTSLKLLKLSMDSSFRLFSKWFLQQMGVMRKAHDNFITVAQIKLVEQKEKHKRQILTKDQQISKLKSELQFLSISNEQLKDKLKKKPKKVNAVSPKAFKPKDVEIKPVFKSIGITAHRVSTKAAELQERTLRHSKEAEISVIQSKLQRAEEANARLEAQICGLRKMLKRQEEISGEQSGKSRQTIEDLETQILEQKRAIKRKGNTAIKLQQENEDLMHTASKVIPLKQTICRIFDLCSQRLEPLLAEQSISSELSELDDLSKEFFNCPIHKIANPQFSRGFLRKQERKLQAAMSNAIESDEILNVFDAIISELQKSHKEIY